MYRPLLIATLLIAVLPPAVSRAQVPAERAIAGTVRSADGAGIVDASVVLRHARDSAAAARRSTDSSGAFRFPGVAPGTYVVEIRRLGFSMAVLSGIVVEAGTGTLDLGTVRLERSVVALDAVAVRGARPAAVVLPDRNVYATSAMPVAAGGTAVTPPRGRASGVSATAAACAPGRPDA